MRIPIAPGLCTQFAGGELGCDATCYFFMPCPAPLQCGNIPTLMDGVCYAPPD